MNGVKQILENYKRIQECSCDAECKPDLLAIAVDMLSQERYGYENLKRFLKECDAQGKGDTVKVLEGALAQKQLQILCIADLIKALAVEAEKPVPEMQKEVALVISEALNRVEEAKVKPEELKQKLLDEINKWCDEQLFDEDDRNWFFVEVSKDKAEVRAELGYESMLNLTERLDPIIQAVDKDAYFDMEDAGIATAYFSRILERSAHRKHFEEKCKGTR